MTGFIRSSPTLTQRVELTEIWAETDRPERLIGFNRVFVPNFSGLPMQIALAIPPFPKTSRGRMELFVGPTNPPTQMVAALEYSGPFIEDVSGWVQPGEYALLKVITMDGAAVSGVASARVLL